MADYDRALEISCVCVCSLGSTHVRRCDSEIVDVERLQVWKEYSTCVDVVNREVEESLDLVCMEVVKHVSDKFRTDGNSWLVLAVLSCPSEIWHYCNNLVSGSSLCCVCHKQKLEEVVNRWEG